MTDNNNDDDQSDSSTNYVSASRSRPNKRNDHNRTQNKGIVT